MDVLIGLWLLMAPLGLLTAYIASTKGRSLLEYFIWSLLFTPLVMLPIVLMMKKGRWRRGEGR